MALRPVFIPLLEGNKLVEIKLIEFQWFPGFSKSQKQKSMHSLHENILQTCDNIKSILEVSSKSEEILGNQLSAFNLMIQHSKKNSNEFKEYSVEVAFQSSKVFEKGGPYTDLLDKTSMEAKKDERLKNSGRITKFKFFSSEWKTTPYTAFYDWLYINALNKKPDFAAQVLKFDAFTDIEFNHEKSVNCQAFSVALFCALKQRNLIDKIKSQEDFLTIYRDYAITNVFETKTKNDLFG